MTCKYKIKRITIEAGTIIMRIYSVYPARNKLLDTKIKNKTLRIIINTAISPPISLPISLPVSTPVLKSNIYSVIIIIDSSI